MRPNLIFINVDQMSALDSVGALGSPHVDTPALDRIVANGRLFTRSFPANPVCCPSRTSWWTGCHTSEHGVCLNDTPCHPDMSQRVVSRQLRAAGVNPFFCGKWHAEGLDVREHFHVLHEASWWGELTDRDISTSACAFLDAYNDPAPFFLNLGFMNPHDICISPCNDLGRARERGDQLTLPYVDEGILADRDIPPLPEAFAYAEPEPHLQWAWNRLPRQQQQADRYDDLTWRMHRYNYHRWVEMVDREIGLVLDALDSSPFRDNTWILFTSDHGEGMSHHHLIGKSMFYREISEVPLVIASLGDLLPVAKGTVDSQHFISGVDIAPTLCAAFGADPSPYSNGLDLLQLAGGRQPAHWRDTIYQESAFSARMVFDGRYKYIRDYSVPDEDFRMPGPDTHAVLLEQLFDLQDDPGEIRNLAADPLHAAAIDRLRHIMDLQERRLQRRPMPGEPGRNWLRQKLRLCREASLIDFSD